jgi:LPXTG-motif cell wall-anchored protein
MSRIILATLLVIGSLLCASGTAFGSSALSTDTNASAAQYGHPRQTVLGNTVTPRPVAAQAPRQLAAANGSDLPFTGYSAIPVVLGGLVLLGGGLMLRRRTRDDASL